MNKKLLIISTIIFIVVVLSVSLVYFMNSNKQNVLDSQSGVEGWKSYDNPKFGMVFWYPQDWFLRSDSGNDYDRRVTVSNKNGGNYGGEPESGEIVVAFEVYPNKENKKIEDYIYCHSLGNMKLVECGEEKIAGIEFKKQAFLTDGKSSVFSAAINNGIIYQVQIFGDVKGKEVWQIIRSTQIR